MAIPLTEIKIYKLKIGRQTTKSAVKSAHGSANYCGNIVVASKDKDLIYDREMGIKSAPSE